MVQLINNIFIFILNFYFLIFKILMRFCEIKKEFSLFFVYGKNKKKKKPIILENKEKKRQKFIYGKKSDEKKQNQFLFLNNTFFL